MNQLEWFSLPITSSHVKTCKATQYTSKYSFKHGRAFHSIHQRVLPSTLVTLTHIMWNLSKTSTCMECVQQLRHPDNFNSSSSQPVYQLAVLY